MKRRLVLENGAVFEGEAFGSLEHTAGEVVFNTGMTGYQEILSDPSYCGQIVTLTYPLIGNYGINRDDFESITPFVKGLIVKELCELPSNWRSAYTLDEYLKMKNIPGLQGIDTRKLTRMIRTAGALKGTFASSEENVGEVLARLKETELPRNQVAQVSAKTAYPSPGPRQTHRTRRFRYEARHFKRVKQKKMRCHRCAVQCNGGRSASAQAGRHHAF